MRFSDAVFKKPSKKRVVLADDDSSVLKMTKARLEHAGYEVLTATNGEEVLSCLRANGPVDLLLLDVQMPKLDGYQVCQQLKQDMGTAGIPVLLFSGAESARLSDKCIEVGANDWIEKPFRSRELMEKVARLLGSDSR